MKVLVCGGRTFEDYTAVETVLEALNAAKPITMIIQGGAKGADSLAWDWAYMNNVPCLRVPALWHKHGKAAGFIRNKLMLTLVEPDLVVAMPGGKGTAMMVDLATKAGIEVMNYGRSADETEESDVKEA